MAQRWNLFINNYKNHLGLALLGYCLTTLPGCNSPSSPPPPPSGISIVEPSGGETFKTTDTVRIIRTCNYDDFVGGTYTDCTLDSGKTWDVIRALVRKSGIVTDTVTWYPADVYPDSVLINRGIQVRVRDYNNKCIDRSGFFFFTNQ